MKIVFLAIIIFASSTYAYVCKENLLKHQQFGYANTLTLDSSISLTNSPNIQHIQYKYENRLKIYETISQDDSQLVDTKYLPVSIDSSIWYVDSVKVPSSIVFKDSGWVANIYTWTDYQQIFSLYQRDDSSFGASSFIHLNDTLSNKRIGTQSDSTYTIRVSQTKNYVITNHIYECKEMRDSCNCLLDGNDYQSVKRNYKTNIIIDSVFVSGKLNEVNYYSREQPTLTKIESNKKKFPLKFNYDILGRRFLN